MKYCYLCIPGCRYTCIRYEHPHMSHLADGMGNFRIR